MSLHATKLDGVYIFEPTRHEDDRGYFVETYNQKTLQACGLDIDFVQDNHSYSARKHTIRGLHCQAPPLAQDKLVRCVAGEIFDVAVDIRSGSPSFGHWVGITLSPENGRQLIIPKGFLHGFITKKNNTEVIYKCSAFYSKEHELSVHFADPSLQIDWGADHDDVVLSEKDSIAPTLEELATPF